MIVKMCHIEQKMQDALEYLEGSWCHRHPLSMEAILYLRG